MYGWPEYLFERGKRSGVALFDTRSGTRVMVSMVFALRGESRLPPRIGN
jgi:hypothetical protein